MVAQTKYDQFVTLKMALMKNCEVKKQLEYL